MSDLVKTKIEDLELRLTIEKTIAKTLYLAMIIEYSVIDMKKVMADQKLQRIAIYGMGRVGKVIFELLKRNGIEVSYCVDLNKNIELDYTDLRHSVDAMTNDVDAVIVTPEMFFEEISEKIQKMVDCRIFLARDFLENILLITKQLSGEVDNDYGKINCGLGNR